MTAFMFTAEGNEPSGLKQLRRDLAVPERHDMVHDITLVGAFYDPGRGSLFPRDIGWVEAAVECCNAHGLPVSPSFRLRPLNIMHGTGQDFLCHPPPSDLVIVGFLFSPKGEYLEKSGYKREDFFCIDPTSGYRLSPHHWDKNAWPGAVERSGAKAIVSFWKEWDRDFTLEQFERPDFEEGTIMMVESHDTRFFVETRVRAGIPFQKPTTPFFTLRNHRTCPQGIVSS